MATEADKVGREEDYGQCVRDQLAGAPLAELLAGAPLAELWAAYRAAVARRDEWVQAYVILCLYEPAPTGCGPHWHLELISNRITP